MFFLAQGLAFSWCDLMQMDHVDRIRLVKRLGKYNRESERQMKNLGKIK